jgi:hypothetical protein
MSSAAGEATRYEQIMAAHLVHPGDLAARFARGSRAARTAIEVTSEHEMAIRDVAAGVAAPALVSSVIWKAEQAQRRRLRKRTYEFGSNGWRRRLLQLGHIQCIDGRGCSFRSYFPEAALNFTTSSAGTRPRSFTSMP